MLERRVAHIAESHPTGNIFDDENKNDLVIRYPYFHQEKPLEFEEDGSYADEDVKIYNKKEYG